MTSYIMSEGPTMLHQLSDADLRAKEGWGQRWSEEFIVSTKGTFAYCVVDEMLYREVYLPYMGKGVPNGECS